MTLLQRPSPPAAALLNLFRQRCDRQVTIQQPAVVSGIQKWQDWVTVPAALQPLSGVEASGAIDPTNVVTTSVYVEFLAGVRPKMRLVYQSRALEIISVINLAEQNMVLQLVVKEVVT